MIAMFSSSDCEYIDVTQARRALSVLASLAREAGPESSLAVILQQARCEIASLLESELAGSQVESRAAA